MHDRNTSSAHKRWSHCVVYENRNQIIFPLLLERKNPKTRVDWLFSHFENLLRLIQQRQKRQKITETVAIAVTKHPAKFSSKKL